jgi:hypothetical protein
MGPAWITRQLRFGRLLASLPELPTGNFTEWEGHAVQ